MIGRDLADIIHERDERIAALEAQLAEAQQERDEQIEATGQAECALAETQAQVAAQAQEIEVLKEALELEYQMALDLRGKHSKPELARMVIALRAQLGRAQSEDLHDRPESMGPSADLKGAQMWHTAQDLRQQADSLERAARSRPTYVDPLARARAALTTIEEGA